jgi:hypothetical protein
MSTSSRRDLGMFGVEHVHINQGGQALLANISHDQTT